jgi:hypothetical protein
MAVHGPEDLNNTKAVKKFKAKKRGEGKCEWCYKNDAAPGITRCLECALGPECAESYRMGDLVGALVPSDRGPEHWRLLSKIKRPKDWPPID